MEANDSKKKSESHCKCFLNECPPAAQLPLSILRDLAEQGLSESAEAISVLRRSCPTRCVFAVLGVLCVFVVCFLVAGSG